MPDVSVIIPARKEYWLARTVAGIQAALRGDTEIIVVIDGEEDGPPVAPAPNVRIIRHEQVLGQRASVNEAARLSTAKYLLKTDGHSMMDEGFDLKLAADCEYDWTVIPTMFNLHSHDMVCIHCGDRQYNRPGLTKCERCGTESIEGTPAFVREEVWQRNMRKPGTNWMWFRAPTCAEMPLRVQYWDGPTKTAFPQEYRAHQQWAQRQGELADVMTGQGACWFLHRERFWELGGLDEGHGSWGQVGVEVACKAWLSGGRQIVNRKTWFAHLFRCGGSEGCPYRMSGREQEAARRYSIELWTSGRWEKQVRPLEWIVDHFRPVPTWDKRQVKQALRKWKELGRETVAHVVDVSRANAVHLAAVEESLKSPKGASWTWSQWPPTEDEWIRNGLDPADWWQAVTSEGRMISVLIPARNEPFLCHTIQDLQKHLSLPYEILVGLDGPQDSDKHYPNESILQTMSSSDPHLRIIQTKEALGMRPTLNRLLAEARGRFILKCDAHVAIAEGLDGALVKAWEPGAAVVARRYDLDTKRWRKRDHSKTDVRRLTHVSEDNIGLRSMAWPEYEKAHATEEVMETMTCSGSLWLIERELWQHWGGWDEEHGHFGQEGAELACKVWLSGGRLLHVTTSWYAHHNRGKATYAMGVGVKPQSIRRSHELWLGDNWPFQKYSFNWLLKKFSPPGWPAPDYGPVVPAIRHGNNCKAFRVSVDTLWAARHNIAEPSKAHRLDIFWPAFSEFVAGVLAGQPDWQGRYYQYLVTHLRRGAIRIPTAAERRRVRRKMKNAAALVEDIRAHGLKSPLEFYNADGRMILWKGYRRLVILRQLNLVRGKRAIGRSLVDKQAAAGLSPQAHLLRLRPARPGPLKQLGEEQYVTLGGNATDKYWVHDYLRYYDVHFAELRRRAARVCEIGVAKGASLKLWRDYFPGAEIIGFDRDPQRWQRFAADLPRTRVIVGDETEPADLDRLAACGPFDIVIDDGSHAPEHQRQLWERLWRHVRPFGWYVIEDIYRSFGSYDQGRCLPAGLEAGIFDARDIRQLHWYYNIVFIQKGP